MPVTSAEIEQQKKNEAQLNVLSEKIIGQTPWGQFYGLMRGAARLGEGSIPHQVCLDKEGRQITVYRSDTGKIAGSFLKPTHEYVTQYLSQGKYMEALASTTGIFGQIKYFADQKKATCITITPNTLINLVNSTPNFDPTTGKLRESSEKTQQKEVFSTKNILIASGSLIGLLGIILIAVKLS